MLKKEKKSLEYIQAEYDSGKSIHQLCKEYGSYIRRLGLIVRDVKTAGKIGYAKNPLTEEKKQKLSKLAKDRGLGGYRPHPNKGKLYNGIWFDSNWEVQVAKSLDENKVKWIRPKIGFIWTDNGNKYYPDFYLCDYDIYLDPKNDYLIKQDKVKIEQAIKRNGIRVIVLNSNQLNWNEIKMLM